MSLPTVILIGDSIRMGYQEVVVRQLEGVARVWGPEQNGGNSQRVLENLEEWGLGREAAVVHLNCGLHDLRKEFDAQESAIPAGDYERNVRRILERLKEECGGQVVWATTTPVNQEWHHQNKGFDRFEKDVEEYNRIASGIADELGIPIDDLNGVIQRAGRDRVLRPDGVHFLDEGSQLLGKAVADCVKQYL